VKNHDFTPKKHIFSNLSGQTKDCKIWMLLLHRSARSIHEKEYTCLLEIGIVCPCGANCLTASFIYHTDNCYIREKNGKVIYTGNVNRTDNGLPCGRWDQIGLPQTEVSTQ
jgi:hypothetical protein